jgi:hypothetical protein
MGRPPITACFFNIRALGYGLTWEMVHSGIEYVYQTLDKLDATLAEAGSPRLAHLIELANLSSVLGNLLATGIVRSGAGVFSRAGPHKYQDLRSVATGPGARNIEIKVSLETNPPKGHLAKVGQYLTCRYVLGNEDGSYTIGQRGDVVWFWEVCFGYLKAKHFNISNTQGDSGKTAVVNAAGMQQLQPVFFDSDRCPYSLRSKIRKVLEQGLRSSPVHLASVD